MSLSQNQLKHVCLERGGAAECRYLSHDKTGACICMKHMVKEKKQRDKAVATFLADCKKQGQDPYASWPGAALYFSYHTIGIGNGAGCSGYPALSAVKQGYDQGS